jgi:NAD(P) transhydrogenase subunit alpha
VTDLTIFVLALLVGIEVIGKVPATLHTPLMSATNSIHGIVLAGALLIGVTAHSVVGYILAFFASVFAAANVVGGYVVTGRMLKMFRRQAPPQSLEGLNGQKSVNGLKGLMERLTRAGDTAPASQTGAMPPGQRSDPPRAEGRGGAWTEERGTSDEGRRRVKSARRRAGKLLSSPRRRSAFR